MASTTARWVGAGLHNNEASAVEGARALAALEARPTYVTQGTADGRYFWVCRIPAPGDRIIYLVDGEGRVFTPALAATDTRQADAARWCQANGRHSFYLGVCVCGAVAGYLGE